MDAQQLRDARNRARLTQGELALRLGVTLRTVGNWERGQTIPRDRLPALRDILGPYLGADASALTGISDAALLAEIARRFERGRPAPSERRPPIGETSVTELRKSARLGRIDPGDAGDMAHVGEESQEDT